VDNLFLLTQIGPDAEQTLPLIAKILNSPKTHKYIRHFARTTQAAIRSGMAAPMP
jgi:hypothetical protein